MSNPCLDTKCLQCCRKTNMILTYHDIDKIKKRRPRSSFFHEDRTGWLRLKNSHGRCVFHDGNKCTIYEDKPEGCNLYPIVYDTDNHRAILDTECPQHHTFPLTSTQTQRLFTLISTLEQERSQRRQPPEHPTKKK